MASDMAATPPGPGVPTLGPDEQRAYDEARAEIRRQEEIIVKAEHDVKPFVRELENTVRRTPEENKQLDLFYHLLGDLESERDKLREQLLNNIEKILDIDKALAKLKKITEQMLAESKKIKSRSSALDTLSKLLKSVKIVLETSKELGTLFNV